MRVFYINRQVIIDRVDASYGGSKATKVPILEVHINGKINTRMKKRLKPMFSGPYVVINQLIKSIWKDVHLKKNFIIHVRGKKYQSNKKSQRLGLLKIWPNSNHSKVHNYLFINFFVIIFFNSFFFPIMYHILNPYKKYWDEIITKNAFEC